MKLNGVQFDIERIDSLLLEALIAHLRGNDRLAEKFETQAQELPGYTPRLLGEHLLATVKRVATYPERRDEVPMLLERAWRNLQESARGIILFHLVHGYVNHVQGDEPGAHACLRAAKGVLTHASEEVRRDCTAEYRRCCLLLGMSNN